MLKSAVISLAMFLSLPANGQVKSAPKSTVSPACKKIFANHYHIPQLDEMSNADLINYTQDFIECEKQLPPPGSTIASKLERLELQSEITECVSVSYSRTLLFLRSRGLQWEFLADGGKLSDHKELR
jgi:hypothetical protein